MDRKEVIERLRSAETRIRAHGVSALYLFGSYARDEARNDSDIDIMVDFAPDHGMGLTEFMQPYLVIEEQFPGVEIGYGTRDSLVQRYRPYIEQTAIRVF